MHKVNVYDENVFLITHCVSPSHSSHQKEQEHGESAGINLIFQSLSRIIFTNTQTTLIITEFQTSPTAALVLTQFLKKQQVARLKVSLPTDCKCCCSPFTSFTTEMTISMIGWQTLHCRPLIRLKTRILFRQYLFIWILINYFVLLDVSSEAGGSVSPVNKRRVFSGWVQLLGLGSVSKILKYQHCRKWLPSIRKLSHGKERSQSIGGHDSRHLQKQPSKTKFKVSN